MGLDMRTTQTMGGMINRLTADPAMGHLVEEQTIRFPDLPLSGGETPPLPCMELLTFEGRPADMYRYIIDRILESAERSEDFGDVAIVFQDPSVLEGMRPLVVSRWIPCTVLGAELRERDPDVRCLTGLLGSVLNPTDVAAFRRSASVDPHREDRLLDWNLAMHLAGMAAKQRTNLVAAARRYCDNPALDEQTRRDLSHWVLAWAALDRMLEDRSAHVDDICWRAVSLLEEAQGSDHRMREKAPVRKLLALAEDQSSTDKLSPIVHDPRAALQEFLDAVNPDVYPDPLAPENNNPFAPGRGITFSTVGASRGLEWRVVWAVGVSDHILPGAVPVGDERRMRDAQRRFYVWSTRARDRLFYCHAVRSGPDRKAVPSRFLEPIGHLLQHTVVPSPAPKC